LERKCGKDGLLLLGIAKQFEIEKLLGWAGIFANVWSLFANWERIVLVYLQFFLKCSVCAQLGIFHRGKVTLQYFAWSSFHVNAKFPTTVIILTRVKSL
jgi:uncharacterized membrane protein